MPVYSVAGPMRRGGITALPRLAATFLPWQTTAESFNGREGDSVRVVRSECLRAHGAQQPEASVRTTYT